MTKLVVSVLLLSTLLASCSNRENQIQSAIKDPAISVSVKKTDSLINTHYFRLDGDSVVILPFEIEISLSHRAREKMENNGETIVVSAVFTGTPKDSAGAKFGEDGSFYVASADIEIPYGQIARFDSIKFSKILYDQLANKDIELGVNVFSGRKSSRDNLLNCEPLFDKVSNIVNKKFILKGKLISGDD